MRLDLWSGDQIGRRELQEDWKAIARTKQGAILMVVADGMGGHVGGEIASRTVGSAFVDNFLNSDDGEVSQRLLQSLTAANNAIAAEIVENPELSGMGTTLLAVLINGMELYWLSVGDCRLWRFAKGVLTKINADHSYGAWLDAEANAGRLSHEEARQSPDRHALRSVIEGAEVELIELSNKPLTLRIGDVVLLASDGVDTLEEAAICEICCNARNDTAARIGNAIAAAINDAQRPHQDNMTLVIGRVQ